MFKLTLVAALIVSSTAIAAPKTIQPDADALKREQRIAELSRAPASALNICRKC
jgi:hypothetical protein